MTFGKLRQLFVRFPLFVQRLLQLLVKKGGAFHGFASETPPLDVVGWDGAVWPFAFPILSFQPKTGQIHLPPIWHGTFAPRGALVCSFVPRMLDYHPEAIPCPYPHASVDVDEVISGGCGLAGGLWHAAAEAEEDGAGQPTGGEPHLDGSGEGGDGEAVDE